MDEGSLFFFNFVTVIAHLLETDNMTRHFQIQRHHDLYF